MIFEGMEFGITGRGKDVAFARGLIEAAGGTVTAREHQSQRGFIVGAKTPSETKMATAEALKVPLLTVEWVQMCVKAGLFLPLPAPAPAEAPPTTAAPAPPSKGPVKRSPIKKMIFDFDEESPEKMKGMRFSMTPPPLKAMHAPGEEPRRRASSPTNILEKYLYKPKAASALFPRAANVANIITHKVPAPPQQVAPKPAPKALTVPVPPQVAAAAPPPPPTWGPLQSAFPPKQQTPAITPRPVPVPSLRQSVAPRPTAEKVTTSVNEKRPTVTASTRPTSRPTSPAPTADAGNRINQQRKPGVPRLAATTKEQDAKGVADALLAKVLQHPAAKSIDAEAAKQILLQIVDTASPVTFADISGLENCKQILQEAVVLPAKRPELFTGLRKPCAALLLFGPPGNGKTMLAKAVACECGTTFFNISASAITSKWVGDSEKIIRALFGVARALSPSTIFIDEIDSLLQARGSSNEMEGSRRLKTEFLVQMDGAGEDTSAYRVLIMGATNRPYDLDDAVLRRFPKRVLVPLPCTATRRRLITSLLKDTPSVFTEKEWARFADMTDTYSASDLSQLCKDMALAPIRDLGIRALDVDVADLRPLNFGDAVECMKSIRPSTTSGQQQKLESWNTEYGSSK